MSKGIFNKIPVLQKKFLQGIANTSPQTFDYTCTCISPKIHNSISFEKNVVNEKTNSVVIPGRSYSVNPELP